MPEDLFGNICSWLDIADVLRFLCTERSLGLDHKMVELAFGRVRRLDSYTAEMLPRGQLKRLLRKGDRPTRSQCLLNSLEIVDVSLSETCSWRCVLNMIRANTSTLKVLKIKCEDSHFCNANLIRRRECHEKKEFSGGSNLGSMAIVLFLFVIVRVLVALHGSMVLCSQSKCNAEAKQVPDCIPPPTKQGTKADWRIQSLELIQMCSKLQQLNLSRDHVTPSEIADLRQLPDLKDVRLPNAR